MVLTKPVKWLKWDDLTFIWQIPSSLCGLKKQNKKTFSASLAWNACKQKFSRAKKIFKNANSYGMFMGLSIIHTSEWISLVSLIFPQHLTEICIAAKQGFGWEEEKEGEYILFSGVLSERRTGGFLGWGLFQWPINKHQVGLRPWRGGWHGVNSRA